MKNFKLLTKTAIVGYILLACVIILSCENRNRITPGDAYAAGWRDGFIQALQKQDWKPKEWREQARKDSIIFFNAR